LLIAHRHESSRFPAHPLFARRRTYDTAIITVRFKDVSYGGRTQPPSVASFTAYASSCDTKLSLQRGLLYATQTTKPIITWEEGCIYKDTEREEDTVASPAFFQPRDWLYGGGTLAQRRARGRRHSRYKECLVVYRWIWC
jgi:hypothetical protein